MYDRMLLKRKAKDRILDFVILACLIIDHELSFLARPGSRLCYGYTLLTIDYKNDYPIFLVEA